MNLVFYQTQYDFENNQKDQLGSKTSIPISAVTFLLSTLSVLVIKFSYQKDDYLLAFVIFSVLAYFSLLTSVYFIFKSLVGFGKYQKLANAKSIKAAHEKFIKAKLDEGATVEIAEEEFSYAMCDRLAEASENNSIINTNRGSYIYRSTFSIAISIIFIIISGGFYLYQNLNSDSSKQININGDIYFCEERG